MAADDGEIYNAINKYNKQRIISGFDIKMAISLSLYCSCTGKFLTWSTYLVLHFICFYPLALGLPNLFKALKLKNFAYFSF